jgi:Protein of unknown function (DUF2950)
MHEENHKRNLRKEKVMKTLKYKVPTSWKAITSWKVQGIAAGLLLMAASLTGCSDRSSAKTVANVSQMTFATPAEAGHAIKVAAQAGDESTLEQILGASSNTVFDSGDPIANKADREIFVTKYDQMNRWVLMSDGTEVLHIGADNFPFPVPIERNADAKPSSSMYRNPMMTRRCPNTLRASSARPANTTASTGKSWRAISPVRWDEWNRSRHTRLRPPLPVDPLSLTDTAIGF